MRIVRTDALQSIFIIIGDQSTSPNKAG